MKTIKTLGLLSFVILALQSCTHVDGNAAKNKEAYNKITQAFETGNTDALGEVVAENSVDHAAMPGQKQGLEGLKEMIAMYREAFPDVKFNTQTILAEGDMVMAFGKWSGTNSGQFMGMPPTGKAVEGDFADVVRFENGKAVEHWEASDHLSFMQQLGVIPTEEEVAKRKQLVNDFLAAMDANNKDGLAAICIADFKVYHPDYPQPLDFETFFKHVSGMNGALSGAKHTAIETFVSGNKITTIGNLAGKHTGAFNGIKPSNKDISVDWLSVAEVNGEGKISSLRVQYNQVAFLKQAGAMK